MINSKHDIVIIGAGISGLSCAQELSAFNDQVNITILEATNRIGGRIKSIQANDGTTLQLGAEYIHGTVGNGLYDFMVEKGLVNKKASFKRRLSQCLQCFPKELSSVYPRDELLKAVDKATKCQQDILKELFMLTDGEISNFRSVGAYMVHRFECTLDAYIKDELLYNTFKSVFMTWIGTERISSGCTSVFDLDIQGFLNWIDLDGDPFLTATDVCEKGFEDVVNFLTDDIAGSECIQLNNEVMKIDHALISGKTRMKVACTNGKEYHADTIVLTVSLGVLKNFLRNNVFSFELPKAKYSSIDKLSYGNLIKVFFKFTIPVEKDISFFDFYPSPKSYTFSDFDKVIYLHALERIGCSDYWLCWHVCDKKFKFEHPVLYLNALIDRFSDMYTEFPNNSVEKDSIVISDWNDNKFFCGSYTYQEPGADGTDIDSLAEPLSFGEAHLLFAGEATSKNYFSSAHGAFLSGQREAGKIKSLYKLL